jgi:hypothetical protein
MLNSCGYVLESAPIIAETGGAPSQILNSLGTKVGYPTFDVVQPIGEMRCAASSPKPGMGVNGFF